MPSSATLIVPTAEEAPVALFGNQVCRSWSVEQHIYHSIKYIVETCQAQYFQMFYSRFNMYDSYTSNVAEFKRSAGDKPK